MEELLREWDGESVTIRYDRATGVWIFVAVHDRTLGMALGGCRLKIYPEPRDGLRDALRLAEEMTFKWAAIDFPFGGGDAVLAAPGPIDGAARESLMLRLGELVDSLGGTYGTGVDLGTTPADMDIVARRTRRVFGRTPENGGAGDPGPYTALGVFAAIRTAGLAVFGTSDLAGRTVLVQGVGAVGAPLARHLARAGARVLVTDALPGRAQQVANAIGAVVVPPEETYDVPCDIFAPCAIGGVLNARSIPRLRCRIVAGGANNQLEEEADAARLLEAGILYAPDFVINAGGAIAYGTIEMLRWTPAQAEARIGQIGETLAEILEAAEREGETTLAQAKRRAQQALHRGREGARATHTGVGSLWPVATGD
jgi:leucine dehydrogenase